MGGGFSSGSGAWPQRGRSSEVCSHLSPALSLLNWSAMMHRKVGPNWLPSTSPSSSPPTHRSISDVLGYTEDKLFRTCCVYACEHVCVCVCVCVCANSWYINAGLASILALHTPESVISARRSSVCRPVRTCTNQCEMSHCSGPGPPTTVLSPVPVGRKAMVTSSLNIQSSQVQSYLVSLWRRSVKTLRGKEDYATHLCKESLG